MERTINIRVKTHLSVKKYLAYSFQGFSADSFFIQLSFNYAVQFYFILGWLLSDRLKNLTVRFSILVQFSQLTKSVLHKNRRR